MFIFRQTKNHTDLEKFYDASADFFSLTRTHWWRDLAFIKDYYQDNNKVLDFGCGNGRLLELLTSLVDNQNYLGMDISEKLLAKAKQKYPKNIFLKVESRAKLPFKDNSFDTIFCIGVFHHFNSSTAQKTLREFQRILKPQGKLILTAWHLWKKKNIKLLVKYFFLGGLGRSARLTFKVHDKKTYYRYCYFWNKRKLTKIISQANFKILKSGISTDHRNKKRNIFVIGEK